MENRNVEFVKAQINVHAIKVALFKQKEHQTNHQNQVTILNRFRPYNYNFFLDVFIILSYIK